MISSHPSPLVIEVFRINGATCVSNISILSWLLRRQLLGLWMLTRTLSRHLLRWSEGLCMGIHQERIKTAALGEVEVWMLLLIGAWGLCCV